MKKRMNLEVGFLILYDWLPMLEALPGKEVKKLLLALIARQREKQPLPEFQNRMTTYFARIIEPVIQRRLEGAMWAQKGLEKAAPPTGTPEGVPPALPHPQSGEENRPDKHSIEERSAEEEAATPDPLRALSEQDEKILLSEGVPADYIREREARALRFAKERGRTAFSLLLEWWKRDRPITVPLKKTARPTPPPSPSSFDVDDFWNAAIEASHRRFTEESGAKSAENPETV